jgi:hypothetical protein
MYLVRDINIATTSSVSDPKRMHAGGHVVATGTPEQIASSRVSPAERFLQKHR